MAMSRARCEVKYSDAARLLQAPRAVHVFMTQESRTHPSSHQKGLHRLTEGVRGLQPRPDAATEREMMAHYFRKQQEEQVLSSAETTCQKLQGRRSVLGCG